MTLKIESRQLVLPGEIIAEGDYLLGEGVYREADSVYSQVLGLVDSKENFLKVIPLKGKYVPKQGDLVIGIVTDIAFSLWNLDLNSHYSGVLSVSNGVERYIDLNSERLSDIYAIGDVVLAKVDNISESLVAGLTMKDRGLYKLSDGKMIEISPTKVPRVIGKKGTMIQMIKDLTGCRIVVGQNGRIWISGVKVDLVVETIRFIEKNAHKQGLTDYVQAFLSEKLGRQVPVQQPSAPAAVQVQDNGNGGNGFNVDSGSDLDDDVLPRSERPVALPREEIPAQRPRVVAQVQMRQPIVPQVKKLGEANLPKLKGAEKPKVDNIDDMEVF